MVLVVVLGRQLEDRLLRGAREPDHGLARERVVPLEVVVSAVIRARPRCLAALELGGCGEVEVDLRVRVFLQKARGDRVRDAALDRARDDRRLALAKRHHHHALRLENGADTHRHRARRHILLAEEIARGVLARDAVERDQARAARARGAWLVEADVARAADAEELQVDAARGANHALVGVAHRAHFVLARGAVGDVGVRRIDVDPVEQVLAHEAAVALQLVRLHGPVFVEVEGDDILEGQPLLAVEPHELVVDARRRRARRETEHAALALRGLRADQVGDLARDGGGDIPRTREHARRRPFCGRGDLPVRRRTGRGLGLNRLGARHGDSLLAARVMLPRNLGRSTRLGKGAWHVPGGARHQTARAGNPCV